MKLKSLIEDINMEMRNQINFTVSGAGIVQKHYQLENWRLDHPLSMIDPTARDNEGFLPHMLSLQ